MPETKSAPTIKPPTVTNAHGEPREFIRFLPTTMTCQTCAPRNSRFGVVYENKSSMAMTVECEWCGNTMHMAYVPPQGS